MPQCKYTSEVGEVQCEEQVLPDSPNSYCIFHEELENKDDEKEMPLFISADGVKKYADEKTSYQSVGD